MFERWHCAGVLPDWIGIEVKLMYDVVVPLGSVRRNTRVASVRAAWRCFRGTVQKEQVEVLPV